MSLPPTPQPMLALRPWAFPELSGWNRLPMSAIRHTEADGTPRIDLDGEWRFELHATPEAALTADGPPRAHTGVPGCWTMQDFDDVTRSRDRPHYTNVQMPCTDLPPHPPAANPTGVYERDVELPAELGRAPGRAARRRGRERAAGAGERASTSGSARTPTWPPSSTSPACCGPAAQHAAADGGEVVRRLFIEDQDQWWHGGITRSVLPVRHRAAAPGRCPVRTGLAAGPAATAWPPAPWRCWPRSARRCHSSPAGTSASTPRGWTRRCCRRPGRRPGRRPRHGRPQHAAAARPVRRAAVRPRGRRRPARAGRRARRHGGVGPARVGHGRGAAEAAVAGVRPWSAETPRLYDLAVTLLDPDGAPGRARVVPRRLPHRRDRAAATCWSTASGCSSAASTGTTSTRDTGRVVTRGADARRPGDVKRFGFNAVRTSHYPNDPALLDARRRARPVRRRRGRHRVPRLRARPIADDPRYLTAFVDRVSRMVRRDTNHPSVIVWSLGNECGYGANHDAAAGWVRRYDPTRPLQYEGAIKSDWSSDQTVERHRLPDVRRRSTRSSRTPAPAGSDRPADPVRVLARDGQQQRHARRLLAGDRVARPGLQGGFIWELVDHGLRQRLPTTAPSAGRTAATSATSRTTAPSARRAALPRPHARSRRCTSTASWPRRCGCRTGERGRRLRDREPQQDFRDLSWLRVGVGPVPGRRAGDAASRSGCRPPAPAQQAPLEAVLATAGRAAARPGWCSTSRPRPSRPGRRPAPRSATPQLRLRAEQRSLLERAGAAASQATVPLDADGLLQHPLLAAAPRLALWRAPTDNDRIGGMAERWQGWGLADLHRTLLGVEQRR